MFMFAYGQIWQTDTASVLTEAIGYIQFLHNQVQVINSYDFYFLFWKFIVNVSLGLQNYKNYCNVTVIVRCSLQRLSVPYMKSTGRAVQVVMAPVVYYNCKNKKNKCSSFSIY